MAKIKQELSYLLLGQQGGDNRIKIIELLKDKPYNLNQLAKELNLNYRTIKHHTDILLDYGLIVSSGDGYGKVYFLSPKLEDNYDILEEIERKLHTVFKSTKLYEKVVEQTHEGIIILDENEDIIFLNNSAKKLTGYKDEELLGYNIKRLSTNLHQILEEVLKKEDISKKIVDIETKSGETKTVDITMDYFYFDGEEHRGISLLLSDLTSETKQREILDALMDHSEVMMAYMNTEFDLLYVNSAYAEKTDHTPNELIERNHFDLFPNGENKRIFKKVLENEEAMSVKDRDPLDSENSNEENIHWTLEPVTNDEDEIKGLVFSLFNKTS
ncbi:MAG: PAS domain-containing protein [Candidatus Saliniplasma sp.]